MDLLRGEGIDRFGSQVRLSPLITVSGRVSLTLLGGTASGSRSSISGRKQNKPGPVLVGRTAPRKVGVNDHLFPARAWWPRLGMCRLYSQMWSGANSGVCEVHRRDA